MNERRWQAQEFAKLAGVTVRALHHYDRLGLLPAGRSAAGYRLYGAPELERLQQIVTLKFIGLSLRQIRDFLRRPDYDLRRALAAQRLALEQRRAHLGRAIRAIAAAEAALARGRRERAEALRQIIREIEMNARKDWMGKYYSEAARSKIRARRSQWTAEQVQQAERDWAALIAEVEAAAKAGMDPACPSAQALARRWRELLQGFTGGDPEIQAGLNRLYADRKNWPEDFKPPYSDRASEFIRKAMNC